MFVPFHRISPPKGAPSQTKIKPVECEDLTKTDENRHAPSREDSGVPTHKPRYSSAVSSHESRTPSQDAKTLMFAEEQSSISRVGNEKSRSCLHTEIRELKEDLQIKRHIIQALEKEIKAKSSEIGAKNGEIKAKDDECRAKEYEICAKDGEIKAKNEEIVANKNDIHIKDSKIKAKDDQIAAKDHQLKAKEDQVKAKEGEIKAKDIQLSAKESELAAKEDLIKVKELDTHMKNKRITDLVHKLDEGKEYFCMHTLCSVELLQAFTVKLHCLSNRCFCCSLKTWHLSWGIKSS